MIATSLGDITIELFADQAPETVATFLALATGGLAEDELAAWFRSRAQEL